MTLKDLVTEFKEDRVILHQLFTLYPDQKKSEQGYIDVIHELRKLKPTPNDMVVVIDYYKDDLADTDEDKGYWHVSGFDPKDSITYGIEFSPWEEWLGMNIRGTVFKSMSMLDAYCHILWEMTWDGFTQEEVQERIAEINERMEDIESEVEL